MSPKGSKKNTRPRSHVRVVNVVLAAVLAVMLCVGVPVALFSSKGSTVDDNSKEVISAVDSVVTERPDSGRIKTDDSASALKQFVEYKLKSYPGEWCVYFKNLKTGESFSINDKPIYPASVIKLFAMGACYQQIEDGRISEQDNYSTIHTMTVFSNNNSFNNVVRLLGIGYINDWCHKNGYTNTFQYHGLTPSDNAEGLDASDQPNSTCASDVGHMLEDIYNGKCVSKQASEKMFDLLTQQHYRNKIPSGIPYSPTTKIANKSGDTTDQSHDAAIVCSQGADYVLVIMSQEEGRASYHGQYFIELSSAVYSYYNGKGAV